MISWQLNDENIWGWITYEIRYDWGTMNIHFPAIFRFTKGDSMGFDFWAIHGFIITIVVITITSVIIMSYMLFIYIYIYIRILMDVYVDAFSRPRW